MPFEGDLSLVSLESVLRNIEANALTGILSIGDERGERKISFATGRIVAFLAIKGEQRRVARALEKTGHLSEVEVEKVRKSLAWKRLSLKRLLEYRGLVTEQEYAQAVRDEVIVPHILELFLHRERTFRFVEKTALPDAHLLEREGWDPDLLAAELRIPVEPLVLEAVKRLDEKQTGTTRYPRPGVDLSASSSDVGPIPDISQVPAKGE